MLSAPLPQLLDGLDARVLPGQSQDQDPPHPNAAVGVHGFGLWVGAAEGQESWAPLREPRWMGHLGSTWHHGSEITGAPALSCLDFDHPDMPLVLSQTSFPSESGGLNHMAEAQCRMGTEAAQRHDPLPPCCLCILCTGLATCPSHQTSLRRWVLLPQDQPPLWWYQHLRWVVGLQHQLMPTERFLLTVLSSCHVCSQIQLFCLTELNRN